MIQDVLQFKKQLLRLRRILQEVGDSALEFAFIFIFHFHFQFSFAHAHTLTLIKHPHTHLHRMLNLTASG